MPSNIAQPKTMPVRGLGLNSSLNLLHKEENIPSQIESQSYIAIRVDSHRVVQVGLDIYESFQNGLRRKAQCMNSL